MAVDWRGIDPEWIATLKVGDDVAVKSGSAWDRRDRYTLGKVKYITPRRNRFDVSTDNTDRVYEFNKDGAARGSTGSRYAAPALVQVTPAIKEAIRRENALQAVQYWKDWDGLTTDRLVAICHIINENVQEKKAQENKSK